MDIPKTKILPVVDELHGIKITDNYRWLEDGENLEVLKWTINQSEYTNSVLKDKDFDVFSHDLARNFKFVSFSNYSPVRGRYFYEERQPDEDQHVLYVKHGLDGAPIKLVDPNTLDSNGTTTLSDWFRSRTGRFIAYALCKKGDEMSTIYVRDVDTNKDLPIDVIPRSRSTDIVWDPDDSGFFYTRNPEPGTVPKNEEHLHSKVFYHKIGQDPAHDELIFGAGRPKDDMIGLSSSVDGMYVAIRVSQKWTCNDVFIYNTKDKKIAPLFMGIESKFSVVFSEKLVLVLTNYKANNYRIISAPATDFMRPLEQWDELIAERTSVLEGFNITKSKILLEYLENACSLVVVADYDGKEIGKVPLPRYSNLTGIGSNREEEEFFYGVESFVFPKTLYRFDPIKKEYVEIRKIDNPINPGDYETKQIWYTSKDGTDIPMFIFHKKGIELSGKNPTILYGYGGFSISQTPSFMRSWLPWLERGGIFAIANIRGGGEFGESWHTGAMKENKQKSFDDFAGAAEFLIAQKYTNTHHIGILGGSNGGLLVSVVMTQHPELFAAVCSRVPLTDMVRFNKFGMALRWVHEYGNPDIEKEFKNILEWSPYHNIKEGVEYPPILFMTAENDTRVDPLHARKMAAALQGLENKNDVLFYAEKDSGHGAGKPVYKLVETQAMALSFFSQKLGLLL